MKKHWNRVCAALLVISLLSACGAGSDQQQVQTNPGAGSTDAQQTEVTAGTGMTETQPEENASNSGTAEAHPADSALAGDTMETSSGADPAAAGSTTDDRLSAEPQQSLEDVFRNHDSYTDDLSQWNSKAKQKGRSAWSSNLTPEEEQAIIDSMNKKFLDEVLKIAYERLENTEEPDYYNICLTTLLEHNLISREDVDRYLLARSLFADNLTEQLWAEIEKTIEKARKEYPDLLPESELEFFRGDGVNATFVGAGMAEEAVMEAEEAMAAEPYISSDAQNQSSDETPDENLNEPSNESSNGTQKKEASDSTSPVPFAEAGEGAQDSGETSEPNTAEYNTIRENPFKAVSSSPLSTFSIDVDTAGYTKLKYDILDGCAIEKDEVKIEELINYFNYDYSGDRVGEEPFIISTEYTRCPWNPGHGLVRIGIRADDRQEKPATNFVLVTDISGSMMLVNKLPLALSAYADMLEGFDEKDTISLMYYASGQGVVLENISCDNKDEIYRGLAALLFNAGGATNGSLGLQTAYEMAEKSYIENGVNRVMIATDGDFNIGATSEGSLKDIVESGRQKGVYLTILGYGSENLKDNKMEVMAENGNGNYHYIGDMTDAEKALVQESASTLIPRADDVKIQVEFNPALVQEYRLIGYESRILNAEDFNNDKVDAGDVGAGKTVTALYEIVPTGDEHETDVPDLKYSNTGSTGETGELCTVSIRYKEINSGKTGSESKLVEKPVLAADYHEVPDDNTALAISLAEAGMVIRSSEYKGSATLSSAEAIAGSVAADTGSDLTRSWADLLRTLIEQSE